MTRTPIPYFEELPLVDIAEWFVTVSRVDGEDNPLGNG